jgi:hypothetical protein
MSASLTVCHQKVFLRPMTLAQVQKAEPGEPTSAAGFSS